MEQRLALTILVLFLSLGIDSPATAQRKTAKLDVYKRCPMEGSARSACSRSLNRLKNRWREAPSPKDINPNITLTAMLQAGDDEFRWNNDDGAEITGFVVSVEDSTGGESCNCGGDSKGAKDLHINLVLDPSVARSDDYECQRVIVEITPRWQFLRGWSFEQVKKATEQKWVTFRGWMFFDRSHLNEALNTRDSKSPRCGGRKASYECGGPLHYRLWRATAWEIHPVTNFTVLSGAPPQ